MNGGTSSRLVSGARFQGALIGARHWARLPLVLGRSRDAGANGRCPAWRSNRKIATVRNCRRGREKRVHNSARRDSLGRQQAAKCSNRLRKGLIAEDRQLESAPADHGWWSQMVRNAPGIEEQHFLVEALQHLQTALDLLDRSDAAAHIGAHVDLAVYQLQETIHGRPWSGNQTDVNAEPQ